MRQFCILVVMKSTITRFAVRAMSLVTMAMFAGSAFAQEAGAGGATQKTMLDKWVIDGGWTMIPLVILLAIILQKKTICNAVHNKLRNCSKVTCPPGRYTAATLQKNTPKQCCFGVLID